MGTSAILPWVFPVSAALTGVNTLSSLVVSSASALLTQLQAFLVSTLAWTLLDTGVSGIAENFVVRSSGVSGDRQICLKFGVSIADQVALSCFACVSFASATDVASNATTNKFIHTYGISSIGFWATGNKDFLCLITDPAGTISNFIYAGLVHEFVSTVTQTPNQVVMLENNDWQGTLAGAGKMVESPTGTFNVETNVQTFGLPTTPTNILTRSDPDVEAGVMYLWPMVVVADGTDRLFGLLKNVLAVGQRVDMVHGTVVVTSAGSRYLVVAGQGNPGLAVWLGDQ